LGKDVRTLAQDFLALLERVAVLDDALQHLAESISIGTHQKFAYHSGMMGTLPECFVARQDLEVGLASFGLSKAEVVRHICDQGGELLANEPGYQSSMQITHNHWNPEW
jgi:hypothetical protein